MNKIVIAEVCDATIEEKSCEADFKIILLNHNNEDNLENVSE